MFVFAWLRGNKRRVISLQSQMSRCCVLVLAPVVTNINWVLAQLKTLLCTPVRSTYVRHTFNTSNEVAHLAIKKSDIPAMLGHDINWFETVKLKILTQVLLLQLELICLLLLTLFLTHLFQLLQRTTCFRDNLDFTGLFFAHVLFNLKLLLYLVYLPL